MDIPEDVRIKSTIRAGSVFYYADSAHGTSTDPHYFVVLNINPLTDEVIILVNCSSRIDKVRRRTRKYPGTLVEITREEYNTFSEAISAFDGNSITKSSIDELIDKLKANKLKQKPEMPSHIVEKLRNSVLASPTVERRYKTMISASATTKVG